MLRRKDGHHKNKYMRELQMKDTIIHFHTISKCRFIQEIEAELFKDAY